MIRLYEIGPVDDDGCSGVPSALLPWREPPRATEIVAPEDDEVLRAASV